MYNVDVDANNNRIVNSSDVNDGLYDDPNQQGPECLWMDAIDITHDLDLSAQDEFE